MKIIKISKDSVEKEIYNNISKHFDELHGAATDNNLTSVLSGLTEYIDEVVIKQKYKQDLSSDEWIVINNLVLAGWVTALKNYPHLYKFVFPEYLKEKTIVKNATIQGITKCYEYGHTDDIDLASIYDESEKLTNNNEDIEKIYLAYTEYITHYPNLYKKHFLNILKKTHNTDSLLDIVVNNTIKQIEKIEQDEENPLGPQLAGLNYLYNETRKNAPEIFERNNVQKAIMDLFVAAITNFPSLYPEEVPKEYLRNPIILSARKHGWDILMKEDPMEAYVDLPQDVKRLYNNQRELIKKHFINLWIQEIKNNQANTGQINPNPLSKETKEKLINEFKDDIIVHSLMNHEKEQKNQYEAEKTPEKEDNL